MELIFELSIKYIDSITLFKYKTISKKIKDILDDQKK